MSPDLRELGLVKKASRCGERWTAMRGDACVRVCSRCTRTVYDLGDVPAEDARALIHRTEGGPTWRFWKRADGRLLTRDCPVGARRKAWRWAVVAATVVGVVAGAAWLSREPPRPPTPEGMRGFACPNTSNY